MERVDEDENSRIALHYPPLIFHLSPSSSPFSEKLFISFHKLTIPRQLLKGLQYVPRVIVTDKLASYAAAKNEIQPGVEHRQHKGLNNRAENSHQPTRQRERAMRHFTSPGHAQGFLSAFGPILDHFRPKRHRFGAWEYRALMQGRFQAWSEVSGREMAA